MEGGARGSDEGGGKEDGGGKWGQEGSGIAASLHHCITESEKEKGKNGWRGVSGGEFAARNDITFTEDPPVPSSLYLSLRLSPHPFLLGVSSPF